MKKEETKKKEKKGGDGEEEQGKNVSEVGLQGNKHEGNGWGGQGS